MLLVKFCWIEKTSRYVGWTEYENGIYYASGETLDLLIKNLHLTMKYRYHKDSHGDLVIDSKPSLQSDMPMRIMTKNFITAAILGGLKHRENKKKYKEKGGLKLLDRETLEKNLRNMADRDFVINGEEKPKEVKKADKIAEFLNKEYDYKVEEDSEGNKKLVVFELVRVAEWKLAK